VPDAQKDNLKAAHVAVVAPHRAGLYETARELVVAERAFGIDARVVDPSPSEEEFPRFIEDARKRGEEEMVKAFLRPRPKDWVEDRPPPPAPLAFAREADVMVSHSGLVRQSLLRPGTPVVHVIHGRPRVCFVHELRGEQMIYSYYRQMGQDPANKAFVYFWPEFEPYWQMLFPPEKLHCLPPTVDLQAWSPGPREYAFQGKGGGINVICTDRVRNDRDIYHVIHGFALFAERHPEARLHAYGIADRRAWNVLLDCLARRGVLGEVLPTVIGLEFIYRSADMVLSPHRIAVRTVREALACGCQLVAPTGNRFTPYVADEEDPPAFAEAMERAWRDWQADREGRIRANRQVAQREFDPAPAGEKMAALLRRVAAE